MEKLFATVPVTLSTVHMIPVTDVPNADNLSLFVNPNLINVNKLQASIFSMDRI